MPVTGGYNLSVSTPLRLQVASSPVFEEDGGGWLQDVPLLERLVADRLKALADQVQGEGWLWVETAIDFPYGHNAGMRQLVGVPAPLDDDDKAARAALQAEYDQLLEQYQGDLPDQIDARLGELERMIALFDDLPMRYAEEEMARAGVFIRLNGDGSPDIARGFVRYEDEPRAEVEGGEGGGDIDPQNPDSTDHSADPANASNDADGDGEDDGEPGGLRPLSERLKLELTAHRTLALRDALANDPQAALLVLLHTLVLGLFYPGRGHETCLEIGMRQTSFSAQAPGLAESLSARAIEARTGAWREQLPQEADGVWDAISALDPDSRHMLLAHCLSQGINAQHDPWGRGGRRRSADQLAEYVNLDMVTAGWQPTVDNYLGRVPKPRILEAVAEGRDQRSADRIAHMKKLDMAKEAETLLSGRGWLPEMLRQPHAGQADVSAVQAGEAESVDPDAGAEASSLDANATPAIAAE
jgi:ParB family chromosome partitioning protein